MIELLTILALLALCVLAAGVATAVERRRNAARVECVECEHVAGPAPLGKAMEAAKAHQSGAQHRVLVVKA